MSERVTIPGLQRRGVTRALVSVDLPFGPVQEGADGAGRAAIRLVKEAGADLVKIDGAADFPEAVSAVARAGIPVWAQFGITPQTALRHGVDDALLTPGAQVPPEMTDGLVAEARRLEQAGAALLDFTNSGPVAGPEVVRAVTIPVIGGAGGGPWLDGRVRMAHAAIGYAASVLDDKPDTTLTSRRPRWTRSPPTARTSVAASTSRATRAAPGTTRRPPPRRSRAGSRHRRDRQPVRGHRVRSAAADVLPGRL
jgi:3-methyl-2-oxobutanoate hydroxymethyltransferase